MKEIAYNTGITRSHAIDNNVETRIFRVMMASVVIASAVSAFLSPWRFTTGLFIGGALSLFNFQWMRSAIGALIQSRAENTAAGRARFQYIARYFVTAGVVLGAYLLNAVSLPGVLLGLSSFVLGLFAEALYQFYYTTIRSEESK